MLLTSASPWVDKNTGKVLWVSKDEIKAFLPALELWCASPIWVDVIGANEFPACALECITYDLRSEYLLTDFISNHSRELRVTESGLESSVGLIEWHGLKESWPSIVNNAKLVTAEEPSPLLAMALWLGRPIETNYCPLYIPSACKVPNRLADIDVLDYKKKANLRLNEVYVSQQRECHGTNKIRKKFNKFIRSPRLFFEDANFFR